MQLSYWMVVIVTLALGLGASAYVKSQLKKYSQVRSASGLTGAQAAQLMLQRNGVQGVTIKCGAEGQDHFDPRNNSISLSPSVYNYASVTAYATACHEVGHACQYATGYTMLKVRSSIVPVVNLASNVWIIILIIGIFLNMAGMVMAAVIMYAVVVVFQLVTLPVEFNASGRALNYMKGIGLPQAEVDGASAVLRACALTYVAAALGSILQLLYLLSVARD